MTDHRVQRNAQSTRIEFAHEGNEALSKVDFAIELQLQCSGAVLVELRGKMGFMSKYLDNVVRDRSMDERMYGGTAIFSLLDEEVKVLELEARDLRRRGSYDTKYAPGASFKGHDMTPVNEPVRSHPQQQGYKEHRYGRDY